MPLVQSMKQGKCRQDRARPNDVALACDLMDRNLYDGLVQIGGIRRVTLLQNPPMCIIIRAQMQS